MNFSGRKELPDTIVSYPIWHTSFRAWRKYFACGGITNRRRFTMSQEPTETQGERLRRLRQQAGLTQEELARAAGVSIAALRHWERDRRRLPLDSARDLAGALGVSLAELAGP